MADIGQEMTIAEDPFEVLAYRIHRDGKPYGGKLLRETAVNVNVVCKTCGPLSPPGIHGWTSDWISLCHDAMDHAKETGHTVAVESWHGAIYGREDGDDGQVRG